MNRVQRSRLRDGCEGLTCAWVRGKDEIRCLEMRKEMDKRNGNDEKMLEEGMKEGDS